MSDPLVDSVLGGHRVVRVLGRGGMGVVYEAVELGLERRVALKVIAPDLAADPGLRGRFEAESRVAASIDHPNVVPIFRAGEDDGRLFLAMRLVDGDDLGTLVRRDGPMAPDRAVRIVAQAAAALEAAHGHGLVHRDVKPANVLVGAGDHVYLTDFGLAKRLAVGADQTRTGVVVGTPDYLAPEQIRGETVGPWTDIYALGCVLFYTLSGRVVFAPQTVEAKLWAHLSQRPPPLPQDVPAALDDVVRTALAKDPPERFRSASAFASAARDAVATRASRAPFVGRTDELARLRELWADVQRDGVARVVRITGERGIGKTRLAAEFEAEVRRDGEVAESVHAALGAVRPTLLVVDSSAGVAELVDARVPVLVLGDGTSDLGGDAEIHLEGLDLAAVERVTRPYGAVPAAELLVATGGNPERVHQLAREWVRREAEGRVEDAATRVASGRREWRLAEAELRGTVAGLQGTARRNSGRDVCPFKGLAAFEFDDADYFFGRERLTAELVARLVGVPLLGIVGASGSGKSSLLRAGLLPALAAGVLPGTEQWGRLLIRPGSHPVAELKRVQAGGDNDRRTVLAVDQFEELFTACEDDGERRAFIDALVDHTVRGVVVVAVRADFYGRCAAYPDLSELLGANAVLVGAMRRDELRRAIEGPAALADLDLEPELVDVLLADVESQPGGLPLLSTALLELWRDGDRHSLRLATYERTGGVSGAVARLAEEAFGRLGPDRQGAARRALLRLAGHGDVRRRVARSEFAGADEDVVTLFAERRLLTLSNGSVEVAHEALLREWPRLHGWLEEDAEGRVVHRQLTLAARDWDARGRDRSDLYRGARLASALEFRAGHDPDLNAIEREFLDAGHALETDELTAAKRRARRFRTLAVGLAALVVIAALAAGLAVRETRRADDERSTASSRGLAAQSAAARGQDVDVAALLGLEAFRAKPTVEARSAILGVLPRLERSQGSLHGHTGDVTQLAFGSDGRTLLSAGDDNTVRVWDLRARRQSGPPLGGTGSSAVLSSDGSTLAAAANDVVQIWDAGTRRRRGQLSGLNALGAMAISGNGATLATISDDGLVLWDARRLRRIAQPLHEAAILSLGFSADGQMLASANSSEAEVRVWDARNGRRLARLELGFGPLAVALSADADVLATARYDGSIQLWDTATFDRIGRPMRGHTGVMNVAFSPDGRTLASTGHDRTVRLWDVQARRPLGRPLEGHTGPVASVAFSADATTLASGGADGTIRLWAVQTAGPLAERAGPLTDVAFTPDGTSVAAAGTDGVRWWDTRTGRKLGQVPQKDATAVALSASVVATGGQSGEVRFWDAHTRRELDLPAPVRPSDVTTLTFSPDGNTLASAGEERAVWLWDVRTRRQAREPLVADGIVVRGIAFSPDGRLFATGGGGNAVATLRLWDARTRRPVGPALEGDTGMVNGVAFDADSETLASAGGEGALRLWDVATRQPIGRPLAGHSGAVMSVAFSPAGNTLASAGADGTVRLWDAAARRPLGAPLTGHTGSVTAVAFNHDGTALASVGLDGTVRLWSDILWSDDGDRLQRRVCEAVRRSLTRAEWAEFVSGTYHETCGRN